MTAASITPRPDAPSALKRRGMMLVLASPPGGGKTTLTREIVRRDPGTLMSVSATTRPRRTGEVDGQHYHFVTRAAFEDMVQRGEILEHTTYHQNFYGTPRAPVEQALAAGRDVIFDIESDGNRSLHALAPADVVSIFLLPPSWAELERRLHKRGRDSADEIARRLAKAGDEIAHYHEFEYVIVNHDLDDSLRQIEGILAAERARRQRLTGLADFIATLKPQA